MTETALQALRRPLSQGCRQLRLELDAAKLDPLLAYVGLLAKWNRVYNLTAVRDVEAMVTRHLLDSLAVVPFLRSGRLLDIGTGAGLPGLPLAIACPRLQVTLLDSSAKKVRFVRQAIVELGLAQVEVVQARMREYQPERAFDMVISRAVSDLQALYQQSQHLLAASGRMLFMKGAVPEAELSAFEPDRERVHIERLRVPGLDEQRHLIWLDKQEQ